VAACFARRTIQKAAEEVPAGSTVEIRGERVAVRVTGAPGARITFRNYAGEHVRLDGTGLGPFEGVAGLVAIDSRAYITVQGLELAHSTTSPTPTFRPASS
jgi:hypothetical protein